MKEILCQQCKIRPANSITLEFSVWVDKDSGLSSDGEECYSSYWLPVCTQTSDDYKYGKACRTFNSTIRPRNEKKKKNDKLISLYLKD